jgi:hypothetical protein
MFEPVIPEGKVKPRAVAIEELVVHIPNGDTPKITCGFTA